MSGRKEKIFVFGASGHAKVVIDVIEKQDCFEIAFIVDDDITLKDSLFCSYPIIGGKEELLHLDDCPSMGIVAIGRNDARCSVSHWLEEHHFDLITAVHPSAQIGRDVDIGTGSVIMANTVINPSTKIGQNVIINTGATIDHDCVVENGVHIAPGSVLCGSVRIGRSSFIGAGSTVINNIVVGEKVMVGAGTTVYQNVPDESKVVGSR